jgi:hypothetical protein
MVRTITAIEIHPSRHKTVRLQYILDTENTFVPTPKQMEDEAKDLAEFLISVVSPHFAQEFIEQFRKLNQSKLSSGEQIVFSG